MKNFLSKNWKKVIYVICGIAIVIDIILIFITPESIVREFALYGPTVRVDTIDKTGDVVDSGKEVAGDIVDGAQEGTDTITDMVVDNTEFSDSTARVLVIFALIICGILILSNIIDGSGSDTKKK